MSLSDNVKNLKFKGMDNDLKIGKTPNNCEVVTKDGSNVDLMPFSMPRDKSVLQFKTGEKIATYHRCIHAWVMENGLSPDLIPEIKGKPTISYEQYNAMRTRAHFLYENRYKWECYKIGEEKGYTHYSPDEFDIKNKSNVINSYLNSTPAFDKAIKNIEIQPTAEDVYRYSATKGNNRESFPKSKKPFHIAVDDVMHCVFGDVKRDKEFERPVAELEKEHRIEQESKFRSLGEDTIKPYLLNEWTSELKKGKCPPFLHIIEKNSVGVHYLDSVPKTPISGVHSIEYFHTPLAKFEDGQWQIGTPSIDNPYLPITSSDIPYIGDMPTVTSKDVLEQINRKETDSLDDFIESIKSDVKNQENIKKEEIGDEPI